MAGELEGRKIAILATTGVEEVELVEPRKALDEAGAETFLISPEPDEIRAWSYSDWGANFTVDAPLEETSSQEYDALYIPGGVMSPDKLRTDERAVAFVREFAEEGKPIASVCHGPWMLAEAGVVEGKRMTSWPSLQTDLRNAGAEWTDEEVVSDQMIITSRDPNDIPAFNSAIIEAFSEDGEMRRAA